MFLKASADNFLSIIGMRTHVLFCLVYHYGRVEQNEYGGAKQVTGNFILYAKN